MHAGMNIRFSNDADVDFIRGMIPHHQGAIEMAQIVLKYGKDEEIRKLANAIIREQRREIAERKSGSRPRGGERSREPVPCRAVAAFAARKALKTGTQRYVFGPATNSFCWK